MDDFFGIHDFDEEDFDVSNGKASKQEKEDLLNFIGGFEKWAELDDDCKIHIVEFMSYWTRCNLSLCSKKDNQIVKEAIISKSENSEKNDGFRIKSRNLAALCRSDCRKGNVEKMEIRTLVLNENFIQIETSSNFVRSWRFHQKDENCVILSKTSMENEFAVSSIFSNPNRLAENEFLRILQKIISKNGLESVENLKMLTLQIPSIDFIEKLQNLKSVELTDLSPHILIRKLNPNLMLDRVFLLYPRQCYGYYEGIPFDSIANPAIINAKTVKIEFRVLISDEQLLSLKATRLLLRAKGDTENAIFEFIRRWVDDELENELKQIQIVTYQSFSTQMKRILEIFDSEKVDYTNYSHRHFRYHQNFFRYDISGDFYQIGKRNNLFSSQKLSVLVTYCQIIIVPCQFPNPTFPNDFMRFSC